MVLYRPKSIKHKEQLKDRLLSINVNSIVKIIFCFSYISDFIFFYFILFYTQEEFYNYDRTWIHLNAGVV